MLAFISFAVFSASWMCDFASDIVAEEFLVIITVLSSHPFSRFSLGFSLQRGSIVCDFYSFWVCFLLTSTFLPWSFPFHLYFSVLEAFIHAPVSSEMFPNWSNQSVDEPIQRKEKRKRKEILFLFVTFVFGVSFEIIFLAFLFAYDAISHFLL